MNIKQLPLLLVLIGITCFSCKEDKVEVEIDPAVAILGKWEVIEIGAWPNMNPIDEPYGYREFLPDSILCDYDYQTEKSIYLKYSIDDIVLKEYLSTPNSVTLLLEHSYEFFEDGNKLRLDVENVSAWLPTQILQKID